MAEVARSREARARRRHGSSTWGLTRGVPRSVVPVVSADPSLSRRPCWRPDDVWAKTTAGAGGRRGGFRAHGVATHVLS